jgi:hypothetical protein
MYLEEDFGGAILVDSVMLLSPAVGPDAKLRVEGWGADGQWRTLASQSETTSHLAPTGLRRAAAEELKSLGFEFIVAQNDTELGAELKRNAKYWGINCWREVEGACVYRLD